MIHLLGSNGMSSIGIADPARLQMQHGPTVGYKHHVNVFILPSECITVTVKAQRVRVRQSVHPSLSLLC